MKSGSRSSNAGDSKAVYAPLPATQEAESEDDSSVTEPQEHVSDDGDTDDASSHGSGSSSEDELDEMTPDGEATPASESNRIQFHSP